jgi:hypothetical protein
MSVGITQASVLGQRSNKEIYLFLLIPLAFLIFSLTSFYLLFKMKKIGLLMVMVIGTIYVIFGLPVIFILLFSSPIPVILFFTATITSLVYLFKKRKLFV